MIPAPTSGSRAWLESPYFKKISEEIKGGKARGTCENKEKCRVVGI